MYGGQQHRPRRLTRREGCARLSGFERRKRSSGYLSRIRRLSPVWQLRGGAVFAAVAAKLLEPKIHPGGRKALRSETVDGGRSR